ncbi:YncE family protein [Georgenia sp. Z1344]|uniref:YncE family protein n=1 Tax=Georgenia sp. Z1344 TaxID=3416706 RepID=UPI003CF480FC
MRTIELSPFNRLHGIAIDDQDRLYVLSEEKGVLLRIDDAAHASAPSGAVATGAIKAHMVVTNRSGSRAYVTGLLSGTVSAVDPHDASRPPVVAAVGPLPESCALSDDETSLFVGVRGAREIVQLDAATLRQEKRVAVQGDPLRVYVVPGEETLLTTDIENRTVTRYGADLREVQSLQFDAVPAGISFHHSKPIAFVTLLDSNQVAMVDLESFTTVRTISTGPEPDVTALI